MRNDDRNVILLSNIRFSWPDTCCSAGEPPIQEEVSVCKSLNLYFVWFIHNVLLFSWLLLLCYLVYQCTAPTYCNSFILCNTFQPWQPVLWFFSSVLLCVKTITALYFSFGYTVMVGAMVSTGLPLKSQKKHQMFWNFVNFVDPQTIF